MRSYDVAITSLAIAAPAKWTDNVLSQFHIPDVVLEHRGVARRIPYTGVVRLALVRELHIELGLSVRDAVSRAEALLGADPAVVQAGEAIQLVLDRGALERRVDQALREALESAPTPRRGRPPRK